MAAELDDLVRQRGADNARRQRAVRSVRTRTAASSEQAAQPSEHGQHFLLRALLRYLSTTYSNTLIP